MLISLRINKWEMHPNSCVCTPKRTNFAICELHSVKLTSRKRRRRNECSNVKKKKLFINHTRRLRCFHSIWHWGFYREQGLKARGGWSQNAKGWDMGQPMIGVASQSLFFSFPGSTNSLILAMFLAVPNEVWFAQSLWKLNCETMWLNCGQRGLNGRLRRAFLGGSWHTSLVFLCSSPLCEGWNGDTKAGTPEAERDSGMISGRKST